ncbi:aminopeptidase, partial [Massilia atriviolacea]
MIRMPVSLAALFLVSGIASAAEPFDDKFRQLEEVLPTPNTIRNAAGAPGHAYWQQRADYTIRARLDENRRTISATETVTYHNNSPDTLSYLWVQLDQNIFKPDSDARMSATVASREAWAKARSEEDGMRFEGMRSLIENPLFEGGFAIGAVKGADGKPLRYTINKTMMRIDLPQPMKPGARLSFSIDFSFNINDAKVQGGRTGYEKFDDNNDLFEIAHWFPRMAAYYDVYGWQHKQFLGAGEFTLEFGDYDVQLTVPADHIVAST